MKKNSLTTSIIFTGLLLLSLGANAFQTKGVILDINSKYINVGDIEMRLWPTVNVIGLDNTPVSLISLKQGDKVRIKTITVNRHHLVKEIYLLQ